MIYYFTIIFWFLLISYGLIAIFGEPLPCSTTGYIQFFLGLTFFGMIWESKDVVKTNKKAKRYLTKRGTEKK